MLQVTDIALPPDVAGDLERMVADAARSEPWWRRMDLGGKKRMRAADRTARIALGASAARLLERRQCKRVVFTLHEPVLAATWQAGDPATGLRRGVSVFAELSPGATFLEHISEPLQTDRAAAYFQDGRWDLWQAGTLFRSDWRWLWLDGLREVHGFGADGPEITPEVFGPFDKTVLIDRIRHATSAEMLAGAGHRLVNLDIAEVRSTLQALPIRRQVGGTG